MAGFGMQTSIWLAGFTALAQSIGVGAGIVLIERSGRRSLLLTSLALVAGALFSLGLSFYLKLLYSAAAVPGDAAVDAHCAALHSVVFGMQPVTTCYRCLQVQGCGYCAASTATDSTDSDTSIGYCYGAADSSSDSTTDALGRCATDAWQVSILFLQCIDQQSCISAKQLHACTALAPLQCDTTFSM
jgi:hypothetical protein